MSFRFITSILSAGALIATVSAAPAKAGDHDDLGVFLGTAATLFILGSILNDANDDKKKATVSTRSKPRTVVTRPQSQRVVTPKRAPLPQRCKVFVEGGNTHFVLPKKCVDRNYRSAARLPGKCLVTLRGARFDRPAYSLRCLRNRGYKMAKR